jgi:hypothetical protein
MGKLYKCELPEVFGYGIVAYDSTKSRAYNLVMGCYIETYKSYNEGRTPKQDGYSFKERFEYYGGNIEEINCGIAKLIGT